MRILLTGATGFAAGHLAEALLVRPGLELHGVSRHGDWAPEWRHLTGRVSLHALDLCDGGRVETLLRSIEPEQIYHLAGYAHAGRSFQEVDAAWSGNLAATRSLYDAVIRWGGRPRILFVGSGLIYGEARAGDQAFDENCLLRPGSPYAASKAAADLLSYQVSRAPGLQVVRARPFNHVGPRQSPQYALAHFAQQIAVIEKGQRPPLLETGNLSPRRDLTDVRDMVQAYIRLMEDGTSGEAYNIGTGLTHSMQSVVDRLLALTPIQIEVRQRADLVRAAETAAVCADSRRLRDELGWSPKRSLDQTLSDTLDYWRTQS